MRAVCGLPPITCMREAPGREALDQHVDDEAGDDAEHQAPVHVACRAWCRSCWRRRSGRSTACSGWRDRAAGPRRNGSSARWRCRSAAGCEIVSLTPRRWRSPPASAIHSAAHDHGGERHARSARPAAARPTSAMPAAAAATPPTHQRAFVADDHQPEPRRQRGAERRSGSAAPRASACSATRTSVPNAPWYISAKASSGSTRA